MCKYACANLKENTSMFTQKIHLNLKKENVFFFKEKQN